MRLETSRYLKAPRKTKEPNQWREIEISEDVLRDALEYALGIVHKKMLRREYIERVIVGQPVNGVYPLSVAISKRKEE